jgi:hypothetical protein
VAHDQDQEVVEQPIERGAVLFLGGGPAREREANILRGFSGTFGTDSGTLAPFRSLRTVEADEREAPETLILMGLDGRGSRI